MDQLPSRANPARFPVELLREVEKFLCAPNVPAARFGRDVMNDPRFVFDLRNGREPRSATVKQVRSYLLGFGR